MGAARVDEPTTTVGGRREWPIPKHADPGLIPNGYPPPPFIPDGGVPPALAYGGGGGGDDIPKLPEEFVTVTASLDEPLEVTGGVVVDGLFLAFQQPPKPPTLKNVTQEQQSRFNAAFNELWKRLHEKDGKNPCAELFGGIAKAEEALRNIHFSVGATDPPDAVAETKGKNTKINPSNGFFDTSGSKTFEVGTNLKENARINELPYLPVTITLGNVDAAAFILLHELGHHIPGVLEDDGGGIGFEVIHNNSKVQKACFPEAERH
jgi:hypothetical protein